MPVIVRKSDKPYRWSIGEAPLSAVANREKTVPRNFITPDGFGITSACRRYLLPSSRVKVTLPIARNARVCARSRL